MGCMKMGVDYHRPELGINIPESFQHASKKVALVWPEDRWWHVFGDSELNNIVEEALRNNLDIKKATARILEVRAQFIQTRAGRFPHVDLQGQVQRQRQTVDVLVPTVQGIVQQERRKTIDSHTLSLPASFELDLWGRLARSQEAARADLLQVEENRRTVTQGVVAETINLYLQMEALERRIQITERSIENYRQSLALVKSRYERGLTSVLELRQARRTLARAEATLPNLRQELGITQQRLAVLLGRYPRTSPPRPQPEDYYKRLSPIPSGLPSDLLLRRPDIRAAEARLRALNARVGEAEAGRFPRITLTGRFGYSSEELDRLLRPQSELWNLALGLVQPLFDAGKLKAGQRAAEARYEQGVAEYARTILNAFSEVERALLTRKEQLERRERVLNFLMEARATQRIAEGRYKRGLVDYLSVLEAQQTRFQAEDNLVQIDLAILTNRVSLHRSLGGGWAEPKPVGPKEVSQF
ncbi:MAG TPA: efflux transporter outer membrane subunit [Desulfobacterales bacterium]|nr:efflux transporter outer membrane subunit [Desulfobacterales bacterium]